MLEDGAATGVRKQLRAAIAPQVGVGVLLGLSCPGGALRVTKQGLEAIDGKDEAVVAPKETSVLNPGVAHLRRPPCTGQCANKTGKAAFAKTCRVAPPNIICLNRLCV